MGSFTNSPAATACLAAISTAVVGINLAGVWAFSKEQLSGAPGWVWLGAAGAVAVYLGFLVWLAAAIKRGNDEAAGRRGGGGAGGSRRATAAGGGGDDELAAPLLVAAPRDVV